MKKIFFFGILGIFLSLASGCKKNSETLKPVTLSADAHASVNTIIEGQTISIIYSSNADHASIELDTNAEVELTLMSGSVPFTLNEVGNHIFTLRFYKKNPGDSNKELSETKTVSVTVEARPPLILSIEAQYGHIFSGESDIITVKIEGATSAFSEDIPGFNGFSGDYPTGRLFQTTIFHLSATNGKDTLNEDITILVDPTKADTLCNFGGWRMTGLAFNMSPPDGPWTDAEVWECYNDDLWILKQIPTNESIYYFGENKCSPDESDSLPSSWSIVRTEDSLGYYFLGDETYVFIEKLNIDSLVLIEKYDDQWVKYIYTHPAD